MDSNTKTEVIESTLGGVSALMKEMFVRRKERQKMEREAELQKEIEQIKAQGRSFRQQQQQATQAQQQQPQGGQRNRSRQQEITQAQQPQAGSTVAETLDTAANDIAQADDLLEQAAEMEDCPLCRRLIQAAAQRPPGEQRELIPELRDFLAGVESDASTEEVAQRVRGSDRLMDLLRSEMSGVVPS